MAVVNVWGVLSLLVAFILPLADTAPLAVRSDTGRLGRSGNGRVNIRLLNPETFRKGSTKSVTLSAGEALSVVCINTASALCLTTSGTEFIDPVSQWDVVALYVHDAQGRLMRTSDKKCIAAIPMDKATWFDLQYVDCSKGSKWQEGGGRLRTTVAGKQVCLYSEEGYGMLDLCSAAAQSAASYGDTANVNIQGASEQVDASKSVTQKIQDTLNDVYKGSFWEYAWDLSVGSCLADADVKKVIDMSKINDYERALSMSVQECRGNCDATLWCKAFDFNATTKKCRLTANPKPQLVKKADALTLVQNAKYKRSDFFLGK